MSVGFLNKQVINLQAVAFQVSFFRDFVDIFRRVCLRIFESHCVCVVYCYYYYLTLVH